MISVNFSSNITFSTAAVVGWLMG